MSKDFKVYPFVVMGKFKFIEYEESIKEGVIVQDLIYGKKIFDIQYEQYNGSGKRLGEEFNGYVSDVAKRVASAFNIVAKPWRGKFVMSERCFLSGFSMGYV